MSLRRGCWNTAILPCFWAFFCPLTLYERIYCTNAMFGIIASVLSWQQWCYQQPKEVQYHCHPVKGFFHELTLDSFSLEDVLPTVIICDWCIGWGLKVDKSICLEVHFCRMLSFSKLFFFPVDGCIKIKPWQFLRWRILWQCNSGRAANRSV